MQWLPVVLLLSLVTSLFRVRARHQRAQGAGAAIITVLLVAATLHGTTCNNGGTESLAEVNAAQVNLQSIDKWCDGWEGRTCWGYLPLCQRKNLGTWINTGMYQQVSKALGERLTIRNMIGLQSGTSWSQKEQGASQSNLNTWIHGKKGWMYSGLESLVWLASYSCLSCSCLSSSCTLLNVVPFDFPLANDSCEDLLPVSFNILGEFWEQAVLAGVLLLVPDPLGSLR